MYCHNCGTKIEDGVAVCPECGTQIIPDDLETAGGAQFMKDVGLACRNSMAAPKSLGLACRNSMVALKNGGANSRRIENVPSGARPPGIVMLATYMALTGAVCVLSGGFGQMAGSSISMLSSRSSVVTVVIAAFSTLILLLGILVIAASYGIWVYQPWGYHLAFLLNALSMPIYIIISILHAPSFFSNLIGIAIAVIILIYLLKPDTRVLYALEE